MLRLRYPQSPDTPVGCNRDKSFQPTPVPTCLHLAESEPVYVSPIWLEKKKKQISLATMAVIKSSFSLSLGRKTYFSG